MKKQELKRKTKQSQRFFRPSLLFFYDWLVFSLVSRFIWQCPTKCILKHYQRFISENHCEVAVGTGYIIDRLNLPQLKLKLTLVDLSQSCLEKSQKRLKRYQPVVLCQNVLEPFPSNFGPFQSVAMNYAYHCIPGDPAQKSLVFTHLKALLREDGVLFGASVFRQGHSIPLVAKVLMRVLNGIGLFNNSEDHCDAITKSLKAQFKHVDTVICGSVLIFAASDAPLY